MAAWGAGQPVSASGGGTSQEVQDLKKALEELRQQQTKQRLEALKQTAADLRLEAVERSLRDLRRAVEERRVGHPPSPLPPRGSPPVPLPPPKTGKPAPGPEGEAAASRAGVTVRLPAGAELFVDGVRCPLPPSGERTFDTPPLEGNGEYYYTLRAEVLRDGRRLTETRRVDFRPGQHVTVSFGDLGERVAALR